MNARLENIVDLSIVARYRRWNGNSPNIIPVNGAKKKPGTFAHGMFWKKYHTQVITPQEERSLFRKDDPFDALGLISGINDWRCFDFDKCLSTEAVFAVLDALGLPEDYEWVVKTGSHKGYHIWFLCDALPQSHGLPGKKEETGVFTGKGNGFDHLELRWEHCQTLLPPSIHSSGNHYEFLFADNVPECLPARVSGDRVVDAFRRVTLKDLQEQPTPTQRPAAKPTTRDNDQWQELKTAVLPEQVFQALGWSYQTDTSNYIGECPLHSSASGTPLRWNIKENYFKCFHEGCGAGGDLLAFVKLFRGGTPLDAARWVAENFAPSVLPKFQPTPRPPHPADAPEAFNAPTEEQPEKAVKPKKPKTGKADEVRAALSEYSFTFNEITDRIMVNGEPMTDEIFSTIYCDLVNMGFSGSEMFEHVIRAEAAKHKQHPVKDYLNALEWDGGGHIESLSKYFKDEDRVFGLYLRKWLIGAVARAFTGGQNPMLVLVGSQGIGKGFFAKWICPLKALYIESPIYPENNDHVLRTANQWIWDVAELGSTTRKADREALKQFLTLEAVKARRPYGKFDIQKPVLASFIGSVNPDGVGFLTDTTGNRRFRPVHIISINRDYATSCNVSQIWAEAVAAYRQGETINLSDDDEHRLKEKVLPKSQVVNIMVEMLEEQFKQVGDANEEYERCFKTSSEILLRLYNAAGYRGKNSRADAMDLAEAMMFMGYQKGRHPDTHKRGYVGIIERQ